MKLTNGQAGTAIGCRSPLGGDSEAPFLGGALTRFAHSNYASSNPSPKHLSKYHLGRMSWTLPMQIMSPGSVIIGIHHGASRSNGGLALPEYWPTMRLHGWPQLLWCASGPCDVELEAAYIFAGVKVQGDITGRYMQDHSR